MTNDMRGFPIKGTEIGERGSVGKDDILGLDFGGNFSNTPGANLKIKTYSQNSNLNSGNAAGPSQNFYGIGVSDRSFDLVAGTSGGFNFYVANSIVAPVTTITNGGVLKLNNLVGTCLTLGDTTATSTSSPVAIDLGGTFSSTPGTNLKLKLFNNGGNPYGLGISNQSLDFCTIQGGAGFNFYPGGLTTSTTTIDSNGVLKLNNTTGTCLALGNSSSASSANPVAIDLGGSFSSTPGANLKLKLFNGSGVSYGIGISTSSLDFRAGENNGVYKFHTGTSGTEVLRIQNSGSLTSGVGATNRSIVGNTSITSGQTDTSGDAQLGLYVLRAKTTNATATVLTANNSAVSTTNQVVLPNNATYGYRATVSARDTSTGDSSIWEIKGGIKRVANAASTVLVGTPVIDLLGQDAGASTWVLAVTADTTNGALALTVTGVAATTIKWTASIRTTETTN